MPTPPQIHLGRRWMLASSTLLALPGTALARLTALPGASAPAPLPLSSGSMPPELPAILAAIEARHGGRLGLSVSHERGQRGEVLAVRHGLEVRIQ